MNLNIESKNDVTITGIKVNLVCNKCHRTWGVYLDRNLSIPIGGDICTRCNFTNKENVENETRWEFYKIT